MKKSVSVFLIVLLAITLIVALFGCVTQKQRARICKTCTKESFSKDSIVYKQTIKDTTIYLTDSFTTVLENPCKELCDSSGKLKPYKRNFKGNKGTISIHSDGKKVYFKSVIDSLMLELKMATNIIENYKREKIIIEPKCELDHVKWYHNTALWISAIYLIGTALFVVKRFRHF